MSAVDSSNTHSLSDEPLEDLLLSLEAREESAELCVKTQVGDAQLHVDRGRLGVAVFGAQLGVDALVSLLSYREGSYTIRPTSPGSDNIDLLERMGNAIREKERKSTRLAASGNRRAFKLTSSLARTSSKLPPGLTAVELRSLAAIDGRTSILNMVRSSKDSAPETLQAFRCLVQLGLATEVPCISVSPTLSMGSSNERSSSSPDGSTPDQRSSSAPPQDQTHRTSSTPASRDRSAPLLSNFEGLPLSSDRQQLQKKTTGRWAQAANQRAKLDNTGYSSVPPTALAAERVVLPNSLRERAPRDETATSEQELQTQTVAKIATKPSNSDDARDFDGVLEPIQPTSPMASLRPLVRHDTPTALSNATVRGERTFPEQTYQLRASEIPVPSNRLDRATLDQLGELDAALKSSRRAGSPRPSESHNKIPSSVRWPASEPGPPSSLGFGLSAGDLPSPGSVPNPHELPGTPPSSGSSPHLPRVGRYEVLARLKRGGMGSVYMCRLSGTAGFRRLFAMKVLHGHLANQDSSLEAFFHEARVLGELHHPNIVGIADVGTPQEPYIVMDYVEGGSLAELFRATASGRDPALVISVILDALSGLSYAHNARDDDGIPLELVHCDVTPHNLLVGIDGTCRVTDFGIAQTKREESDRSVLQGKPGYLAPERLRRAPADPRSDVFSMGVILYTGLAGVEPFRSSNAEESAQLTLQGRVLPPSEVGLRPPPALDWVCMKALATDPEARFSSAEEMANQLRRIADREELIASTSEVGRWVKASLGPTLAARRAASLRGTGHTDAPPVVASITPPAIADAFRVPSDAPSAAEHTGPIDPPSSQAFDDDTEIIKRQASERASATARAAQRTQRVWSFVTIVVGICVAFWAFLKPGSFRVFFSQDAGVNQPPAVKTPPPEPIAPTDADATPGTSSQVQIDDDGKVIIPRIRPSGEE